MSQYLAAIWKCRYFLLSLVHMHLRSLYLRSALAIVCSLLHPIVITVILCVVFPRFFGDVNVREYAPSVLVGLCFWNFITSTTLVGSQCLIVGERYIRQYPAPMAIYPLRTVLGSTFHFLMALLLVLVMRFTLIGFSGTLSFVTLIPTFLMIFVAGWSLAVLSGFVTAYFPDMQHLAEVGLQILFYATPIIYPTDKVGGKLGWIIHFNPLTAFIELLRAPLLHGEFPEISRVSLAAFSTAAIAGAATLMLVRLQKKIIFQL